jgi:hypothetical protein
VLLFSSVLVIAASLSLSARADLIYRPRMPGGSNCDNWERECARLYGPQTKRWFACMNQPQAKYDCQTAEGYANAPPQENPLCGNWHRECARLFGSSTRKFGQCMRQPQALIDCGRH